MKNKKQLLTIEQLGLHEDLRHLPENEISLINNNLLSNKSELAELIYNHIATKVFHKDNRARVLARKIRRRLSKDYDMTILISGYPGNGKSRCGTYLMKLIDARSDIFKNIAWVPSFKVIKGMIDSTASQMEIDEIADYIQEKIDSFNYDRFIETFKDEFDEEKIRKIIDELKNNKLNLNKKYPLKRKTPIILDEAVKVLFKGDFQKKGRKNIVKFYNLCREENKATFLIIPDIKDMDKYFREGRVNVWIHIPRRGIAIVFAQNTWNPFKGSPWFMKYNEKIISEVMAKEQINEHKMTDEELIYTFSHCKGYKGFFTFPDWTEEEAIRYKLAKAIFKYASIEDKEKNEKRESEQYLNLFLDFWGTIERVKENWKLTWKEMSEIVGKPASTLKSGMNRYKNKLDEMHKKKQLS